MHGKVIKAFLLSAVLAVLVPGAVALALAVPPAPELATPIVDQAGTLTGSQIDSLNQQIAVSRAQKDYQFGILIIKSLEGNALEDYALKVARAWGIGDSQKDNGVLLLIAKDDRQIRIEVGRGLEADLTDLESGRIIRNTISPEFKKGDYYTGISLGIQNIAAQVEGRPEADTSAAASTVVGLGGWADTIMIVLFIGLGGISWLAAILARSKSWWAGGIVGGVLGLIIVLVAGWVAWSIGAMVLLILAGLLLDWVVSRNYASRVLSGGRPSWWAGGSWMGGGFGGSGGGSFGGGGFGGGGASGGW